MPGVCQPARLRQVYVGAECHFRLNSTSLHTRNVGLGSGPHVTGAPEMFVEQNYMFLLRGGKYYSVLQLTKCSMSLMVLKTGFSLEWFGLLWDQSCPGPALHRVLLAQGRAWQRGLWNLWPVCRPTVCASQSPVQY